MPAHVIEIEELRRYLAGVMERAGHHADNVNDIALALMGAIIWRKDPDQPIQVLERDGETKNALWVHIGGKRYVLSYNHGTGAIDLRRGSVQGETVRSFTNATPLRDLREIFRGL